MHSHRNGIRVWGFARLVAVGALVALAPAGSQAADKGKRYGLEGTVLEYDAAKSLYRVKVVATKVSGGFGMGGVAGDPAPKEIKTGEVLDFAVVPEGSVLSRTVIKSAKGGGLDNTGTREGFERATKIIPNDRPVIISFEENKPAADGKPAWVARMIQIRLSPEEIRKRLEELGIDPAEVEGAE